MTKTGTARPSVGAIRWDAWSGGAVTRQVERTLAPARYHGRLPWFAEVRADGDVRIHGNRPNVMAAEIGYAASAGLDYWAFLLYPEADSMSDMLALYLASPERRRIGFCLILHNAFGVAEDRWPQERDRAVALLREPGYWTTPDRRPLVYAFALHHQGAFPAARFAEFKAAARRAGVDPSCVFMGWDPAADWAAAAPLGFDAVSHYACGSADSTFGQLAQRVEDGFWAKAATANVPYVPLATTGWDKQPRRDHPVSWEIGHDYHTQPVFPAPPEPAELAAHLGRAVGFVRAHPDLCPADTVIVYAWNEFDEGGWLEPTWTPDGPDTRRLDAFRGILAVNNSISPPLNDL